MLIIENKNVLICPLDWGLGHASRDIPLIYNLLRKNNKVIIAADCYPYILLKSEFPEIDIIRFPSFKITYSNSNSFALKLFIYLPYIIFHILKEHRILKKLIKANSIDVVISDNRFGLWNKKIKSIFITHQIFIQLPTKLKFFEPLVWKINKWFISKYNYCWIPDNSGKYKISGDLVQKKKLPENCEFIGLLSKFSLIVRNQNLSQNDLLFNTQSFDILVVLSGPEPQRTILENIISAQIENSNYSAIIVRGVSKIIAKANTNKIKYLDILSACKLEKLIIQSKYLICRAGFTTIMDLLVLCKKAILIPTPGQTEQEYLAKHLGKRNYFIFINQNTFQLHKSITLLKNLKPDYSDLELDKLIIVK